MDDFIVVYLKTGLFQRCLKKFQSELIVNYKIKIFRNSPPEVLVSKSALKIWSKCTREHLCRSMKLYFDMGVLLYNMLHIFRTPFYKNAYGVLLLNLEQNLSRLFQVLAKFHFVSSEIELDYYH